MKISKIMLTSILCANIFAGAMADEYDGARNRCKANPNKIWVENAKECIPQNPCADTSGKYDQYCNRDFREFVGMENHDFASVVRIYNAVNHFDCGLGGSFELFEQDHVLICNEDDYTMVFQFAPYFSSDIDNAYSKFYAQEKFFDTVCNKIFAGQCEKTKDTIYNSAATFDHEYWKFNIDTNLCSIINDNIISGAIQVGSDPCKFMISWSH